MYRQIQWFFDPMCLQYFINLNINTQTGDNILYHLLHYSGDSQHYGGFRVEWSRSPPTPVAATHPHTHKTRPNYWHLITIPSNGKQAKDYTHSHTHTNPVQSHIHKQNPRFPQNTSAEECGERKDQTHNSIYACTHTSARAQARSPWKQAGERPVPLFSVYW